MQRRRIQIEQIEYIGKESNKIEDVESGVAHSEADIYTHYPDPRRDEWETKIRPALKNIPLNKLIELSGMSRSALKELRAGRSRPQKGNRNALLKIIENLE